ncbi:MAG TPA: CYTH and CHAD domain-containing protein [Streptosporangiaceae bacterium]|nr:CYTH and CHAD domain-containing protein [Streptosporangiaceae bacterium]
MTVSTKEIEAKYEASSDVTMPSFDELPQVASTVGPVEHELTAEYFDTEDLRLIRAGITLRRRIGGEDAGWHLKLPVGPQAREEIRLPLGRGAGQVPRKLAELVRSRTRSRPLVPIASIATVRRMTTLLDQGGRSLAEIADDQVTARGYGADQSASQWREVEVELTGGNRGLLADADSVLRRAGLHPAGRSAKLERVLGDRLPAPGRTEALTADTPAGLVIVAFLRTQAETLKSLDPAVRRNEPDAVHQMRVTTRRLRSALRSFQRIISGTGRLAGELQWLGGVLGEARDAEVQAERLMRHIKKTDRANLLGPVQERVEGHFAKSRATALAKVRTALNSERYYALLDELDAVVADAPRGQQAEASAGPLLAASLRGSFRKAKRRFRAAQRASGQAREVALHQARKAAKQARYNAEAVSPVLGRSAVEFGARAKKLQSVLGAYQDTVIGRQLARAIAIKAHQAGENTFSYGLFYGRDAADARQLQKRAVKAWKNVERARPDR